MLRFYAIIAALCGFILSKEANAQIEIQNYQREWHIEVDQITQVDSVKAITNGGKLYVHIQESTFSGGCPGTLVRTYHFFDDAGQEAFAEQYLFLSDHEAPLLIGVPSDTTARISEIKPPPVVSSKDNSGKLSVVYFKETKEDAQVIREWTCVDECGNTASARQIITLLREG